ncbi:MAG: hypothetical protein CMN87_12320 [Stappia sp.]|uniref:hypothetical protein n=1 Tax=Stappia sp. TaxID=1870903 RepID=UPI000C4AF11A|nr:hypothetical protein [Stappia sp.]MAB00148.1 hypothetical protein [Stappia sp.]MBM20787.1 hypothetical protein [Stappia sp.]
MRALSTPRAYAWAFMTGHVGFHAASELPWHHGPLLIHAGEDPDPTYADAAVRLVALRSGLDEALLRNSLHLMQPGTIVGAVTVTGQFACPTPDDPERLSYELTNPRRAYPAAPCPAGAGLFTVPDDVLARLDIPGYVEGAR